MSIKSRLKCSLGVIFTLCVHAKIQTVSRTVPAFATAHTFCPSRKSPRTATFLRYVLTNSKLFLRGL